MYRVLLRSFILGLKETLYSNFNNKYALLHLNINHKDFFNFPEFKILKRK